MPICPHCGEKGITKLSKVWSGSSTPSKCEYCGEYSYLPSKITYTISMLFNGLIFVAVIASFYFVSLLPVVGLIVSWMLTYILLAIYTPSVAISRQQAVSNRRNGNIFVLVLLLAFLFIVLWQSYANASNQHIMPFAYAHSDALRYAAGSAYV